MTDLEKRLYIFSDHVIYMKDVNEPTLNDVNAHVERLNTLSREMDEFSILLDLTTTKPPEIEARVAITNYLKSQTKLKHLAVFTEKNFFLNAVSQTIFSWSGLDNFSIHKTKQEAIRKLQKLNLLN